MLKHIAVILILLPGNRQAFSQDDKSISVSGYLTSMQTVMFDSISGPFLNENLLHNRLNIKTYINDNITFALESRNRLFTGDMVRSGQAYTDLIGKDNGLADLSWNLFEEQSFLFNTTVDRLWLDFHLNNLQVTVGRQRINWGQTFVWNPNDLFNAYSFFDFDYIERPGSDAVRFQYFPSSSSAAELAVKIDADHEITAAGLYRFNKWSYDIQFIAGIVNREDVVIGTGWSGAIGSTSFRGEASWFEQFGNSPGAESTILFTTGFDRIFKENSMTQIQFMYCNNPLELNDFNSFYTGDLSAKNLAFSQFSAFGQFTWAANPLLNLSFSTMWLPDLEGIFLGPTVDYSLAENLDFSVIWQHFNSVMADTKTRINLGFLRLKYSF